MPVTCEQTRLGISYVTGFGAKGDGVSDDRAAFQAAIDAAETVVVPPGVYSLGGGLHASKTIRIVGHGPASRLRFAGIVGQSPCFWLGAATINGTPHPSYPGTVYSMGSGELVSGQFVFDVVDSAGLAAGDHLCLFLGVDEHDGGQHRLRLWTVVASVVGTQVTIRTPLPEAVPAIGAPQYGFSPTFHRAVKMTTPVDCVEIGSLTIEQSVGSGNESVVCVMRARNVHLHDLYMPHVEQRAFVIGECENVVAERIELAHVAGGVSAAINVYGSRNVCLRDLRALHVGPGIDIENQCRGVTIERVSLHGDAVDKNEYGYLRLSGHSLGVVARDLQITNASHAVALTAQALRPIQESEITTENVSLHASASIFPLKWHRGQFSYRGITYREQRSYRVEVALEPNMAAVGFELPDGLLCRLRGRISDPTGVKLVRLHSLESGGYAIAIDSAQEINRFQDAGAFGEMVTDPIADQFTSVGDSPLYTFNSYPTGHVLRVTTDGTVTPGAVLQLSMVFLVPPGDDGVNGAFEVTN